MGREDRLEVILGKAIYKQLRERCKGYIKVEIRYNECFICIRFDDIEFAEIYDHVSEMIITGDFTSKKIVDDFTNKWKRYYHSIIDKKLFYKIEKAP